ncbi:mitosis inhibitor protein kinase swe1 [Dimargaris cristalligena]|nr:mitosis inhibitor protein kinase swe1 [Dimargaris cristalligena]
MALTPPKKVGLSKLPLYEDDVFFATPTIPANRVKKRTPTGYGKVLSAGPNSIFSPSLFQRSPSDRRLSSPDSPLPPSSLQSENFFTPQPSKLVKPSASAFLSTGLLSKRNRPKPVDVGTPSLVPDTPCKKTPSRFAFATTATPVRNTPFAPNSRLSFGSPLPSALPSKKHRIPSLECLKTVKRPHLGSPGTPDSDYSFQIHSPIHTSFSAGPFSTIFSPSVTKAPPPASLLDPPAPSPFDTPYTPSRTLPSSHSKVSGTQSPFSTTPALGQPGCRYSDASLDDAFTVYESGSNRDSWISLTGSPSSVSSISTLHSYSTAADDSPSNYSRTNEWVYGNHTDDLTLPVKDMMQCDDSSPITARKSPTLPQHPLSPNLLYLTDYPNFLTTTFFELTQNDPHRLPLGPNRIESPMGTVPMPPSAEKPASSDYVDSQFVILDNLGSGEFSDVFKVQDRATGCMYAIKKTKFPFSGRKDRLRRLDEVQIMWALGAHPHCVQLFNAWEQQGQLYLQTELMDNSSLDRFLDDYGQHEPLSEERVWYIFSHVALGLKHMHDLNILHLDVKPANVFISEDWTLKLADFGMSARLPLAANEFDREGDREYIAPEVLTGCYDKPADIFSLGLLLLEVTANVVLPDNGPAWQKLRSGDLSDCQFDAGTSSELVDLITEMLQPLPEDRPTIDQIVGHPCVAKALVSLTS